MQPAEGLPFDDAARKVAQKWATLVGNIRASHPTLTSLVAAAAEDAVLSSLFPFTSLDRLCFSRCVDYPYWVDIFIAPVANGLFSVRRVSGDLSWIEGEELGQGDAEAAVAIAVAALPADYGPALPGNAESLRFRH